MELRVHNMTMITIKDTISYYTCSDTLLFHLLKLLLNKWSEYKYLLVTIKLPHYEVNLTLKMPICM